MLAKRWQDRRPHYDFLVIGSGYGGAITAARLAAANISPKPTVCILERGKEWEVGDFPDRFESVVAQQRNGANPLGLYELLTYRDISVIKGSGLGGTSLINANVAILPDEEAFGIDGWPASLNRASLMPFYQRAAQTLAINPHPRAHQLEKVQALDRRAEELGLSAKPLNIAVNFTVDGTNEHGVPQKPCIDCGDCVTGCNVGAKNTLAMNYLPMAKNAGAEIFTQTKVEWIEKLAGGGYRVHGRYYSSQFFNEPFTLSAGSVFLAAGAINSTEILMRSEMHGLSVSSRVGTSFGGNGDFFGLAYNGDYKTDVLGFGNHPASPWKPNAPGPTIVSAVRYNSTPIGQRLCIEDLSFPNAYVEAARVGFSLLRGEDTDTGDSAAERNRVLLDIAPGAPRNPGGAMNQTMLYLCMGFDDARGNMVFESPWFEPDGRMRIEWDGAGSQIVFRRLNEELRRHARAQGGSFIQNPMWSIFNLRHLITAHPLGGCPVGADYTQGAVDEYGRVFAGDGSVHDGLYVCDGAIVPAALGVNPFLTISALAERIVARKIEQLQGNAYPLAARPVTISQPDPLEVSRYSEPQLERLFRRVESKPIGLIVNGGGRTVDAQSKLIRNDEYWKGFFPRGHILNTLSAAVFTSFKKQFTSVSAGVTSDTDGRIRARNVLEEISVSEREGDLEPGRYVLLRYADPPWQGFYDILKVVSDNLIIGRVYFGTYPHGVRQFTFSMTRVYGFQCMTVEDHRQLWASAAVPDTAEVAGTWRMDVISNANQASGIAHLDFEPKPDGRLEARYRLLGLLEGLVLPSFVVDHFRLTDFTPFHDEIRRLSDDLLIGKYITDVPDQIAAAFAAESLGVFHIEGEGATKRLGFYYLLQRESDALEPSPFVQPFLDARVPDGVGMTFDEEMVGWYEPGLSRATSETATAASTACSFDLRMTIRDLNEFIEGPAHEAAARGTINFGDFEGRANAVFTVDESRSYFNYLRVNAVTGEAEMRYFLRFRSDSGKEYVLDGRKYMQKDQPAGPDAAREVLSDYTTLFYTVSELNGGGSTHLGAGVLKFRTFEDLPAIGNLIGFLRSFTPMGTDDPLIRLQAQMRFLAFTAQFVQREYDPLALPLTATQTGGK